MSNATTPGSEPTSAPAATPQPSNQQSSAPPPASSAPPAQTSQPPAPTTLVTSQQPSPAPVPSTSQPPAVPTTTQQSQPQQPTTTPTTTSTTQQNPATTTRAESTQQPVTSVATTVIVTNESGGQTSTIITFVTQTQDVSRNPTTGTSAPTSSATGGAANSGSESGSGKLSEGGTIAIAVVVPIAAVALLILAGLYFWKKRKQRKDAEEERRKEVEDYAYNPNADPTIPSLGDGGSYEMKEDGSSGYRGWGSTTLAGSTGRKASTTMSGGNTGVAYSDTTSPTRGTDTRSGEPLINDGSYSPDGEILGAMGPSAARNRGVGVQRGPSNASSSYSAGNRSDTSDGGIGMAYSGNGAAGNAYYDQYGNNPYSDNAYGDQRANELPGQPVIRDNPARRNTRIENPSHYPQQQNAGISQNF